MQIFDAATAAEMAESVFKPEFEKVITDIKIKAELGDRKLHIYNPLKEKTMKELELLGFKIAQMPSIAVQRDGLYYTITW